MANPVELRMLLVFVILAATTASILALTFMNFPESAVIAAVSIIVLVSVVFFVTKKERAAMFEAYYGAVQDLGTPINFGKRNAAFERNGTRFDIEFPRGKNQPNYTLTFFLPGLIEKFSIENKTLLTSNHPDCVIVEGSSLPTDYLVKARRPEFVSDLLQNPAIRREVMNYDPSFWGRFIIAFADGSFELVWVPPIARQLDGISTMCHTAVVFYDELSKLTKK